MINKKSIIIIIVFAVTFFVAGSFYYRHYFREIFNQNTQVFSDGQIIKRNDSVDKESCLINGEIADYEMEKIGLIGGKAIIKVSEKNNNTLIKTFVINDIFRNYHPIELYRCGIYAIRMFNYDTNQTKQGPEFKVEIWNYLYSGEGEKIMVIDKVYSYDFRVSPDEKYLVLEKSYLGKDDYSLVIKDLNTKKDAFVLRLKDVLTRHPDVIPGTFGLGSWTEDGKYLRGDIFQGALSTAYYQIEAGTWKTDIFAASEDILAGVERAVNFNNWRLAYVDIPTFVGVEEVYQQIIKEAKEQGKQKNLFVYNLKTKEKTKIASADPEWIFNIQWLSDSRLQYELPNGEKKIHEIQ